METPNLCVDRLETEMEKQEHVNIGGAVYRDAVGFCPYLSNMLLV